MARRKTRGTMISIGKVGRSLSRRSGGLGSMTGITSHVLPISAGFIAGIAIPKLMNLTGPVKYLALAGIGLGVPMLARGIVSRKTAVLAGAGVLGALVVNLADQVFFSKQGNTPLLADIDPASLSAQDDVEFVNDTDSTVEDIDDKDEVSDDDGFSRY